MDRRSFLSFMSISSLAIFASAHGLTLPSESTPEAFALGTGPKENADPKYITSFASKRVSVPSSILIVNLKNQKTKEFPVAFSPHLICQNPKDPRQLFAFQKWGKLLAEVRIDTGKVRYVTLPDDRTFFGHGVFHPSGEVLFCSGMNYKTGKGELFELNPRTLKIEQSIKTLGVNPHDLQLSLDGKHLLVMNMGPHPIDGIDRSHVKDGVHTANIAKISLSSHKVVQNRIFPTEGQGYSHFWQRENGDVLVAGITASLNPQRDKSVAGLMTNDGVFFDFSKTSETWPYLGEALNVISDDGNSQALISIPDSDVIVVMDLKIKKVLKSVPLKIPRSLALVPGTHRAVVCAQAGNRLGRGFFELNTKTFEVKPILSDISMQAGPKGAHATWIAWDGVSK